MRILQLIDTLNPGGAERMAVNYANALLAASVESHICVTREEGVFKNKLRQGVHYHFLKKQNTLDLSALLKLRKIINEHKIDIIHAHGSSWFFAVLCKIAEKNLKMIWHDHYGQSDFLKDRKSQPLKYFSKNFDAIISVNKKLRNWSLKHLNCEKVILLNNFIADQGYTSNGEIKLKGEAEYNLICVANLRPQKDHLSLLKIWEEVSKKYDIALHLVGKSFDNPYSLSILKVIENSNNIYYYGEQENILSILQQADMGILSSQSEGLPLVLLEYGIAGLPVVCTDVGQCKEVLGENAILVEPGKPELFAGAVNMYLNNEVLRIQNGKELKLRIEELYSEKSVIPTYLEFCREL